MDLTIYALIALPLVGGFIAVVWGVYQGMTRSPHISPDYAGRSTSSLDHHLHHPQDDPHHHDWAPLHTGADFDHCHDDHGADHCD